ncbi:MAG: acyltransferase [Alphaproteobacteria bacterium]|nr:acyltransferase [Alphaproteobacteria bacterium]
MSALSSPKYRPDIDGLRAIAVLAVVAFHASPQRITGGFVGVDVFFVISGFLISTIIYENLAEGRFSLSEFYARRIRRIFPALILVLGVCAAMGWIALFADEYAQLGRHIAAGAGFASNFILWSESGYFDNAAATKPLLHLWSLGIEEQFYIVWPAIVYLAWRGRLSILLSLAICATASFYWNAAHLGRDAIAVFYSPLTRAWELLSGGLLAWLSIKGFRISETTIVNLASVTGAALIVGAILFLDSNHPFPGFWALLPVLGTCLIIAAGPDAWINRNVLGWRPVVWIGLISFPLYLWHWPLLSFPRIVNQGDPTLSVRLALVATSFLLAWLTYRFLESPIRRSGGASKTRTLLLVVTMAFCGGFGFYINARDGFPDRMERQRELTEQIATPDVAANRENCLVLLPGFAGHCVAARDMRNLAETKLLVLGDSHGEALSYGLADMATAPSFLSIGKGGCLPLIGVFRFVRGLPLHCDSVTTTALGITDKYDLTGATVLIVARYAAYVEGSGFGIDDLDRPAGDLHIQYEGPKVDNREGLYRAVFMDGLSATLSFLSRRVARIVVVLQVPELGFNPRQCISRPLRDYVAECALSRRTVLARQKQFRDAVELALRDIDRTRIAVYDPLDVFCDPENCRVIRDGVMLYRDDDHVSVKGAEAVLVDMRRLGFLPP